MSDDASVASGGDARDERDWDAEKRDFVADQREEVADARDAGADERDADADERELLANERERAADERERRLDLRGAALGLLAKRGHDDAVVAERERHHAAERRGQAHAGRAQEGAARDLATQAREEVGERRRAATGTTGLALAFAEIARHLYEAENFEAVLERIVDAAVAVVTGCDMASVTVRDDGTFRTLASTDERALKIDLAQYDVNEGPCLDALGQSVVHAPAFPDERWSRLGSRPVEDGVHAVASYRLAAPGGAVVDELAGSLNAYTSSPEGFGDDALEIGLILALHASSAIRAVREREALERFGRQLHEALSSRDVIGQAKGILMERLKLTPDDAFDFLRRASQRLNVKLVEVAGRLAETGPTAETGELETPSASN